MFVMSIIQFPAALITAILAIGVLTTAGDSPSDIRTVLVVTGVFGLIVALAQLAAGLVGISNASKPARVHRLVMFGVFLVALWVVFTVLYAILGQTSDGYVSFGAAELALFLVLLVPQVLYLVAAVRLRQRSNARG